VGVTTVCGAHHSYALVVIGMLFSLLSFVAFYYIICDCGICHGMPVFGHFGQLLLTSLICKPLNHSSIHMLWAYLVEIYTHTLS